MSNKVKDRKAAQDPRERLLRPKSVLAIMKTWTPKMRDVGEELACLPVKPGKSKEETLMNTWGFVFAIDALRDNHPAIQALAEVVGFGLSSEMFFTQLPTHQELFAIVDRLLALKVEVRTKLKNHVAPDKRTSGKVGFVRRRK